MDNHFFVLLRIVVISYLIGSIPFGLLTGKVFYNKDIRKFGSKNIGATNVLRTLGVMPGILVLLLDALKGYVSLLYVPALNGINLNTPDCTFAGADNGVIVIYILSGIASIIGHNWTIFLGFKGGKGVATSIGVALALAPVEAGFAALAFIIITALSRFVSVGSMLSSIVFFTALLLYKEKVPIVVFGGLACLMIIIRHIQNIERLLKGTENRIWQKK